MPFPNVAVWPPRPRQPFDPSAPPDNFVSGDRTVTVRSSDYPPGGVLLVVVQLRNRPTGPWAAVNWFGYADLDKVPTCVDITDPGTD